MNHQRTFSFFFIPTGSQLHDFPIHKGQKKWLTEAVIFANLDLFFNYFGPTLEEVRVQCHESSRGLVNCAVFVTQEVQFINPSPLS